MMDSDGNDDDGDDDDDDDDDRCNIRDILLFSRSSPVTPPKSKC